MIRPFITFPARRFALFCLFLAFLLATPTSAQTHGYGFGGVTVGKHFPGDGAGRLGIGGNWRVAPYLAAGAEVGTIHKDGTGALVSGNVGLHPLKRVEKGFDPFFVVGIAGLHAGGETGVYAMVGGGLNYWFHPHFAARTEFRGYPGGQDMNSFGEFRFGISFR